MLPNLIEIQLLQKSRTVSLVFDNGQSFCLSCEYLRVFSPSAEVRGHGLLEGELVVGKQQVNIVTIEQIGHYAVRLVFDDGHRTGIYSWPTLYTLACEQDTNWQRYLARLSDAGVERTV